MKVFVRGDLAYGDMELCARTGDEAIVHACSTQQSGAVRLSPSYVMGDVAILHACKDPCHRRVVGYTGRTPARDDPHYYTKRMGLDLYLNLIDPAVPLFAFPVIVTGVAFIEEHVGQRRVWVHCDKGMSRAPSLVLLYLARRGALRDTSSYEAARAEFTARWPYAPGQGIQIWLAQQWGALMTWRAP